MAIWGLYFIVKKREGPNLKESLKKHKRIYFLLKKLKHSFIGIREKQYANSNFSGQLQLMESLRDKHFQRRCFIIGNGPSLRAADLDKLENEITFAANRIFKIFPQTKWRPTYYLVQDPSVLRSTVEQIESIHSELKFIPIDTVFSTGLRFDDCIYFYKDRSNYPFRAPKFSSDITKRIYEGYTVTYTAMQIAAYMGFTEIYLLGVDASYSITQDSSGRVVRNEGVRNYFSTDSREVQSNPDTMPNLEYNMWAYQVAESYAEKHGIRIYNATRGGQLEVFPRVDFDEVIASEIESE